MADEPVVYKPEDLKGSYVADPTPWVEGDHPTDNPDGVTNSNVDYWPKTQEEKAEAMEVEMIGVVSIPIDEPYPDGDPQNTERDRIAVLLQAHTPQELVSAADFDEQHTRNLKAGGSVEVKDVMPGAAG